MNFSKKTLAPKPIKRYISTYSFTDVNQFAFFPKTVSAKNSKSVLWNSSMTSTNNNSSLRDSLTSFSNFENELENDFAYLEINSILNKTNMSSSLIFSSSISDTHDSLNRKSSDELNITRPENPFLKNLESIGEL